MTSHRQELVPLNDGSVVGCSCVQSAEEWSFVYPGLLWRGLINFRNNDNHFAVSSLRPPIRRLKLPPTEDICCSINIVCAIYWSCRMMLGWTTIMHGANKDWWKPMSATKWDRPKEIYFTVEDCCTSFCRTVELWLGVRYTCVQWKRRNRSNKL